MKSLAIDTSIDRASVAISDTDQIIYYNCDESKHKQAENLILMIEDALEKTNITYQELSYIATCIGPGSFTGARVGISAANGLHFALNINLIGVMSLEAIALASKSKKILAILDAGRGQCYSQFYINSIAESAPKLMDKQNIKNYQKEWDIVGCCLEYQKNTTPNAKLIARSAYSKFTNNDIKKSTLKPLYIRQPDAITLSN